ncbi:hypothetical protein BU26DRAFT_524062 [Trematosphaeria pertusa]|uniref:CENP-V/GFA domain-containing protein n=1 Tax=Trematosphaeria pertusa TaxID=390896 RepID=A0A6A6HYI5_9PLEO|nr:uncharacterized protein BU26DRAFT_524062 [Trematosphaeria pertusa]KAF2243087.1 hypothetical protein BU26DRAFT_524062 [Trematosphaeria pertusa]
MASEAETVTLTAHCLCKAHVFTTTVSRSNLPLPAYACHCDSCRHSTGALYSIDAPWPEPRPNVDTSALKSFHFSPSIDILFCGTCSTPMFFAHSQKPDGELGIFTGTLQNGTVNPIKIVDHIYVGDTTDGGATMWLRKPNEDGTDAKRFRERGKGDNVEEYPWGWPAASSFTGYEARKEDSLPIRCKCKGVDLVLHRGSYDGKKREELPWFIDPATYKPLVGFCGCESCRLFSGVDVWTWTFAELENISFAPSTDKAFPKQTTDLKALVDAKDPSIGTLTYYASSPDVQRYFCGNCSACIFYAVDDRPHMVDVAVGVLEASDGARAEGFLSWAYGKVSRMQDSGGGWRMALLERVEKECEEWRIGRGYPKNWMRIAREQAEAKAKS